MPAFTILVKVYFLFSYCIFNSAVGNLVSMSHQVTTRWYRPPELLYASKRYSASVDIWSSGVVLAELLSLSPLFPGTNDIDQIYVVFQVMGTPKEDDWPV